LFEDNFDRADSRNIDASFTGITDNTGAPLVADAVYSQPWLDPNNAAPTYGVQDDVATNGGGAQILSNAFQLAVGFGTSNAFVNHNFTNPEILAAGGFSVNLDVLGYLQASNGQGAGFAIGMSQAEANSAGDAFDGAARMTGGLGTAGGTTVPAANVADFWFTVRGNNTVAWGGKSGNVSVATGLPAKVGTLSANFRFSDFNAGSTVNYEVMFNGTLLGTGTFTWSENASNYIGIDARDSTAVILDNFRVATDFIEPLVFPPVAEAFAVTRLEGANDTRLHWRVKEGTLGDPVTITIKDGATVLHTTSMLTGFADVNAPGATTLTLTATNSNGAESLDATVAAENAFSNAVRADAPAAWYRFNESFASPVIADSAVNAAPHDGTVVGLATTGGLGALDGAANFGGNGSFLTDFILDPAATAQGHTVEAIVRRYPGSTGNAAVVSQNDGTGVGRSHLAVDSDGTLQTFLAGGPVERKDSDGKLPADNWAHLTMVVDKLTPEIRWYIDGVLIDTTADGVNPDGSTYNPSFTLESATGAWRIGTQKLADQNFWLGDMDEVVIYDKLLDDPDGNGDRADSRVAAHANAWFSAGSGLFGIAAASETIDEGEGTALTIKVGADVTSVSVDQGIGTVVPVNGIVTIPVNPAATTTYTVTVEGPGGTQIQSVTVTVIETPVAPPLVTATSVSGGNVTITFTGAPDTTYYIRSSSDLGGFATDLGTAATDGSGNGSAVIAIPPNTPRQFYRLQDTP
jgi:hypothetical protein